MEKTLEMLRKYRRTKAQSWPKGSEKNKIFEFAPHFK